MRNEWQEIFRRAASNGIREQRERERELGSRETLRVAIGRFHKKKHRCRAAICATCLAGGRRKESGNGITILSSRMEGRKEGGRGGREGRRNTKEPRLTEEAILHFEDPTLYSIPRRTGSTRRSSFAWRCRSRHLLLALFFPATRHLHNYNLASAVSKTRAPDRGHHSFLRTCCCCCCCS